VKRLLPLILFFVISRLFAGELRTINQTPLPLQPFMRLSAQTYNSGKECRHAAAEVAIMAGQDSTAIKVPMYWVTKDKTEGHTFPVLLFRGSWWAIDSVFDDKKGRYIPISQRFQEYHPKAEMAEFAKFTHRPLLEYIGDATAERLTSWLDEEAVWGLFKKELERTRKKLQIGEKILKIFDKGYPGTWQRYLDAVALHRSAAVNP
jgi:hypothetical protein